MKHADLEPNLYSITETLNTCNLQLLLPLMLAVAAHQRRVRGPQGPDAQLEELLGAAHARRPRPRPRLRPRPHPRAAHAPLAAGRARPV